MVKQLKAIFIILFLFTFIVLGCETGSKPAGNDKYGGVLVFSASTTPTIIHPFLTHDSISIHLVPMIFNGITKVSRDGNIILDLAESYEIKQNGLEYNIKLKKGIKFHDGNELTSEDVKFTFEKIKEANIKKTTYIFDYDFSLAKDIKIIDKYNIKIILEKPFASFLYHLTLGVLPKHVYQGKKDINDDIYWHPVGTGPFKLKDIAQKKIILERFDDYFKCKPYLKQIICEIHPPSVIWAKLLKGEIDYSESIPLNLLKVVKKADFLRTDNILGSSFCLLVLNCRKPFFKDKKARQALNYAIDKELLVKSVLKGQGRVCSSPMLPGHWAYSNDVKPYEYNPQKALQMLKEAGWTRNKNDGLLYRNGKPFTFNCLLFSKYPNFQSPAVFIKIGIKKK